MKQISKKIVRIKEEMGHSDVTLKLKNNCLVEASMPYWSLPIETKL
jgi:hypothetical protein